MAHLKKSASTGHLLKNASGHLVKTCGLVTVLPKMHFGHPWRTGSCDDASPWKLRRYDDCGPYYGVSVAVQPGTYRVTYYDGAWSIDAGATWNRDYWRTDYNDYNGALWCALETDTTERIGPGAWLEDGYATAAEAEEASAGDSIDIEVASATYLWLYMKDNPGYDNAGQIRVSVSKIA